jgi:RNA polymerase sigma-70 factor (ECF subfamily)
MGHTTKLQDWLEVARRENTDVRNEVIAHACERLRALTHNMLRGYPRVRRWSETDDVLQNAMLRLHRSLAEVKPESPAEFYGLAAIQVRRELLDLARHYYGAEGLGSHHDTDNGRVAEAKADEHSEPETLERWTAFHEHVDQLPEEQREVVGLLWYEGLSQPEAAAVLEISLATLKRRWQAARLTLFETLKEIWCEE